MGDPIGVITELSPIESPIESPIGSPIESPIGI